MAKRQTTTIRSLDEFGGVLGEYASAVLERENLENMLERRIGQLREECRGRLDALAATAEALLDDMAAYAVLHPEMFPEGKKSLDLAHGTVGMRTGTPRVTLKKGLKEEDVVAKLDEDGIASLVREKRELDKAAAIRDWALGGETARRVESYGIRVSQTERFFAEIKREEAEA